MKQIKINMICSQFLQLLVQIFIKILFFSRSIRSPPVLEHPVAGIERPSGVESTAGISATLRILLLLLLLSSGPAAAQAAAAFVGECLRATPAGADERLGVWLEAVLPRLMPNELPRR